MVHSYVLRHHWKVLKHFICAQLFLRRVVTPCSVMAHCVLLLHRSAFCCDGVLPLHCRLLSWLFLVNACWLKCVILHHCCLPTLSYTVAVLLLVVAAALVSITGCVMHPCLHNVVVASQIEYKCAWSTQKQSMKPYQLMFHTMNELMVWL